MKERPKLLDAVIIGGVSLSVLQIGVLAHEGISEAFNPSPALEVSGTPDRLVFNASSDTQMQNGIKAAMEICKVKNVVIERQHGGDAVVNVGCEQGTVTPTTLIFLKPERQGK